VIDEYISYTSPYLWLFGIIIIIIIDRWLNDINIYIITLEDQEQNYFCVGASYVSGTAWRHIKFGFKYCY
jgi:hypothetical protein